MIGAPRSSFPSFPIFNHFSVLDSDVPALSAENVIELAGSINMVPQPKTEQKIRTTIIGNGTQSLFVMVKLQTLDTGRTTKIQALVDSGATGSFVDRKYDNGTYESLNTLS